MGKKPWLAVLRNPAPMLAGWRNLLVARGWDDESCYLWESVYCALCFLTL